jgi:hypothetical protein
VNALNELDHAKADTNARVDKALIDLGGLGPA